MNTSLPSTTASRLGFHYFPDSLHYRESDLRAWVPELRALGAAWVTLIAPADHAIPEAFIQGMLAAGIEPILHFRLPPSNPPPAEELQLLFEAYARWGVTYAVLFDRPNRRRAWAASDWSQRELVERFIDTFAPLAEGALRAGLRPVFPPLEPGGDFWDTAFLRLALQALQRRGLRPLLSRMALGAYAWLANRPLNWGAGGPERWPGARPYHTPKGEQDQRGFRIFDWYLTISQAALGKKLPILALGTGCHLGDQADPQLPAIDLATHTERNLQLARLLAGEAPLQGLHIDPLPDELVAVCFWLLATPAGSPHESRAWFRPDGQVMPVVGALRQWLAGNAENEAEKTTAHKTAANGPAHPIAHYLLLPTYEWGVSDWHLDVIRPFVKAHRPTIGFSLVEAALATHVTVVGGPQSFPDEVLDDLRAAGCSVERIQGDGTHIATQLESR